MEDDTTTLSVSSYDSLMLAWLEGQGSRSSEELSIWMLLNMGIAPDESERWLRAAYGRGLIESAPDQFDSEPEFADLPRWRLTDAGRDLRRVTSDTLKLIPPSMTSRLLVSAGEGFALALKTAVAAAPLVLYGWLTGLLKEPSWKQGLLVALVAFAIPTVLYAILYSRHWWEWRKMPWNAELRDVKKKLRKQGKDPRLALPVVLRRQREAERDVLRQRLDKLPAGSPDRKSTEERLAESELDEPELSDELDQALARKAPNRVARFFNLR